MFKPDITDIRTQFESFQTRAKAEWKATEARAKAELDTLPTRLQQTLGQAWTRFRDGLDLPTRKELSSLASRLEELAKAL